MKTKPSNIAPFKVTHTGDAVGGLVMDREIALRGAIFLALWPGRCVMNKMGMKDLDWEDKKLVYRLDSLARILQESAEGGG